MARLSATIALAFAAGLIAYLSTYLGLVSDTDWVPFRPPAGVLSTLQQQQQQQQHNFSYPIANINSTLLPHLSPAAQIHLPGSPGFAKSTERWNSHITPTFALVVEVATEADVQAAIQWANNATLPFLAVAGGHGVVQSLSGVSGGVGIWMRGMRDVEVLEGGRRARVEGGVLSGEMVHALWERGKMTVTGACECTGVVAPMLGGGHGWLQGQHALMADNLISARLVLANASVITVSETEHAGLFWALKGAGHNFGIVTSFEYKIYDRTPATEMWSWEQFIFRHDQVRDVYSLANAMLGGSVGEQPVELVHWSYFLRVPDIDPDHPLILFFIMYQSPSGVPDEHTKPFTALSPLVHTTGISTLPEFAAVAMLDMNGPYCIPGTSSLRYPVSTVNYTISAMEAAMDTLTHVEPDLMGSAMVFEAYSLHAVQTVPAASTAFPDRENGLLMAAVMLWNAFGLDAGETAALEERAARHGKKMRDAVVQGNGGRLNAYVNYANGDEGLRAMYGYEEWRLERLRTLKETYDPLGGFSWYAPIK